MKAGEKSYQNMEIKLVDMQFEIFEKIKFEN